MRSDVDAARNRACLMGAVVSVATFIVNRCTNGEPHRICNDDYHSDVLLSRLKV